MLLSEQENHDMKVMQEQMAGSGAIMPMPGMMPGMGAPGMGGPPGMGGQYNPNPMLQQERNELKVARHEWFIKDSEKKILKRWKN